MPTKFEAAIFNEEVLNALNEGDSHKHLNDSWANTHYFEFIAETAEDAMAIAKRKYRADRGFVIKAIEKIE